MKHEDLSALVDGEIGDEARPSLLDALSADVDARGAWRRYHVIGDVLRSAPAMIEALPAAPLRSAEVVTLPARRGVRPPLAGLAVAASVALVAVLLVNGAGMPARHAELAAIEDVGKDAVSPQVVATVGDERDLQLVPTGSFDQRLDGYLVNFNEQRSRLGVPGVHPYVRIVGFDAR
ncbi:MAG: sigma-E factor negative regulatory protein [Gammaproteobacteria bacterium]